MGLDPIDLEPEQVTWSLVEAAHCEHITAGDRPTQHAPLLLQTGEAIRPVQTRGVGHVPPEARDLPDKLVRLALADAEGFAVGRGYGEQARPNHVIEVRLGDAGGNRRVAIEVVRASPQLRQVGQGVTGR